MKRSIDVANVLVQNGLSEILLLQRSLRLAYPHTWGLPGGMIDEGETALRAGMRELKEEAGIIECYLVIAGVKKFLVETPDEDIRITNIHAMSSLQELPVILSPDEHIAYKWVNEAALYASSDLMPGSPTMIAATLHDNFEIVDLTVSNDVHVTLLK